ncbi:MAG: hypothetical protein K2V38_27095, partial [Gemmataceae bacterium]|nr:hypothetical protein [Gemmataceae bacterium]
LPPEQRAEARKRVLDTAGTLIGDDAKYPTSTIVPVGIINTSQLFETDTCAIALLRVTATAVACERFRLKHRRFPTTLTDLTPDFLTAVPTDPHTGKSLLYKPAAFNPVVYATGPDGIDNGGANLDPKAENGGDIGFLLFNPQFRRQPPMPQEK